MKTINGKEIEEVFQELAKDFPKHDVKFHEVTKKPYVPVNMYVRIQRILKRQPRWYVPIFKSICFHKFIFPAKVL